MIKRWMLMLGLMGSAMASHLCESPRTQTHQSYEFENILRGHNGQSFLLNGDFPAAYTLTSSTQYYLNLLNQILQAQGTRLVMVLPPAKPIVESKNLDLEDVRLMNYDPEGVYRSYQDIIRNIQSLGIVAPDLSVPMLQARGSMFIKDDPHWSGEGAKVVARSLADVLQRLPEFQHIEEQKLALVPAGGRDFRSNAIIAIEAMCGPVMLETLPQFTLDNENSALLGDEPEKVVLVGTSFAGNPVFGFSNFLSAFLKHEVRNEAIAGGGYEGSFLNYLSTSRKFLSPPQFLLWELPGFYNLNRDSVYRQVVSAAKNDCQVVASSETDQLFLKNVHQGPVYIRISAPEKRILKLNMSLVYANDEFENVEISKLNLIKNTGEFYYLSDPFRKSELKSISVEHPDFFDDRIRIEACV